MLFDFIGPTIAIAVNLSLAIWALVKQPRNPAYRNFAFFGISLVIWNMGGQVFYRGGEEALWLRLSFIGMAMSPANFLSLALAVHRKKTRGEYWRSLLYVPFLAVAALNPAVGAEHAISPAWRSGFYALDRPSAVVYAVVSALYLLAGLWVAWRESRRKEGEEWPLRLVQIPLIIGMLAVLAMAWLRRERSPTVSLWTMVMSQYAMFLMVRHKMVSLDVSLRRGAMILLSALALAGCVALGALLTGLLIGERLTQEVLFILIVGAVALCVLFAALLPRIEQIISGFFRRGHERNASREERHE